MLHQMVAELEAAGMTDVRTCIPRSCMFTVLNIGLIFLLWGLDPVVGYLIIHKYSIATIDLTLVRFWSLTVISGILLFWQHIKNALPEIWLPIRNISLWFSVILLIFVAVTTYKALQTTLPSHYTIPMTTAGILLSTIATRRRWLPMIGTWALVLTGISILIFSSQSWPWEGIIFTILAVVSFSAFSIVSERYKKQEYVAARTAQYFFVLSVLCVLLTLPLIPLSTVWTCSPAALLWMVLFSIFFAGLPYYLYYLVLSHREIDFVLRYSFLIILASVGGQALILNRIEWPVVLSAGSLVIIGALIPLFFRIKYSNR